MFMDALGVKSVSLHISPPSGPTVNWIQYSVLAVCEAWGDRAVSPAGLEVRGVCRARAAPLAGEAAAPTSHGRHVPAPDRHLRAAFVGIVHRTTAMKGSGSSLRMVDFGLFLRCQLLNLKFKIVLPSNWVGPSAMCWGDADL